MAGKIVGSLSDVIRFLNAIGHVYLSAVLLKLPSLERAPQYVNVQKRHRPSVEVGERAACAAAWAPLNFSGLTRLTQVVATTTQRVW